MKRQRFQLSSGLILRDCAPGCSGEFGTPLNASLDAPIVLREQRPAFDAKRASSVFTPEWRAALSAGGVLFCPACRSRNRSHAVFCNECGVEIAASPIQRRRPAVLPTLPPRFARRRPQRKPLAASPVLVGLLFVLACGVPVWMLGF